MPCPPCLGLPSPAPAPAPALACPLALAPPLPLPQPLALAPALPLPLPLLLPSPPLPSPSPHLAAVVAMPPITGSGMSVNTAAAFPTTASTMSSTDVTCITARLPTCNVHRQGVLVQAPPTRGLQLPGVGWSGLVQGAPSRGLQWLSAGFVQQGAVARYDAYCK